ncbi:MAG: Spy/CpxP family protein refolding chaperone [Gammaproteobacteria bacterium]|nr:Spy/CpxP family protein refolding chaperone [Gammaproteobacteria bacterium]
MRTKKFAGFLLAAALGSGAAVALAQNPPLAEATPQGHWHGRGEHRPHSAFMRALHTLDLTDSQHQQIRDLVKAQWQSLKPQMQALREQRRAFDQAVPGSAEFSQAQSALAQAQTQAIRTRLQAEVNLRNQIYALLSDPQKAQLATALAAGNHGRP